MNGDESWLRMKKDQEQYEKTIIELKGRAARFQHNILGESCFAAEK